MNRKGVTDLVKTSDVSFEERMRRLERRANVVRSRLLRAVDALDSRRRQISNVGKQAKRLVVPAALVALGVVALIGGSVFAVGYALKKRRRRSLSGRVSTAVQVFDRAREPSLARRVLERITLTVVSIAATEIAKRTTRNALDGRAFDGRLAVRKALDQRQLLGRGATS